MRGLIKPTMLLTVMRTIPMGPHFGSDCAENAKARVRRAPTVGDGISQSAFGLLVGQEVMAQEALTVIFFGRTPAAARWDLMRMPPCRQRPAMKVVPQLGAKKGGAAAGRQFRVWKQSADRQLGARKARWSAITAFFKELLTQNRAGGVQAVTIQAASLRDFLADLNTPFRTTPHSTTPHHTTQCQANLHHTTPHHTPPHHTTPHHTTPVPPVKSHSEALTQSTHTRTQTTPCHHHTTTRQTRQQPPPLRPPPPAPPPRSAVLCSRDAVADRAPHAAKTARVTSTTPLQRDPQEHLSATRSAHRLRAVVHTAPYTRLDLRRVPRHESSEDFHIRRRNQRYTATATATAAPPHPAPPHPTPPHPAPHHTTPHHTTPHHTTPHHTTPHHSTPRRLSIEAPNIDFCRSVSAPLRHPTASSDLQGPRSEELF